MFGKDRGSRKVADSQAGSPSIVIGGQTQEVEAIIDATERYSWKATEVKEIRLGRRAGLFREVSENRAPITIGDATYSYAGGAGFDSQGYFVLVEKVEDKAAPAAKPVAAPVAAPRSAAVGPTAPPFPEQPVATSTPPGTTEAPPPPGGAGVSAYSEADFARYSKLTLDEYESLPMSEAARVPLNIVEALHHQAMAPASAEPTDAPEESGGTFLGEPPEPGDYSQLTMEDYEAMPVSEAAKVPPQVVDRLHRRGRDRE